MNKARRLDNNNIVKATAKSLMFEDGIIEMLPLPMGTIALSCAIQTSFFTGHVFAIN